MSRGVKLSLASVVLLLGAMGAMLFRHPAPSPSATQRIETERPILRPSMNPKPIPNHLPKLDISKRQPPQVTEASPVRPAGPLLHALLDADEPPPEMARVYPRSEDSSFADTPGALGYRLPQPADARPTQRIHKVADGDTLALLAERYLGNADRAKEIVWINRAVLHSDSPEALPIGVELKIPPRQSTQARKEKPTPEQQHLVPVPL